MASAAAPTPVSAQLVSGAVSGVVAEALLHPLDTISTRLKVLDTPQQFLRTARKIAAREGWHVYWKGLSATLALAPPSSAIYFLSYETTLAFCERQDWAPGAGFMIAGATAELASSVICIPQEVIKNRMQLGENPRKATKGLLRDRRNYQSALQAGLGIVRNHGFRALYAGWGASILVDCTYGALQFYVYETGKAFIRQHRVRAGLRDQDSSMRALVDDDDADDIPAAQLLGLGFVAGGVAAWASNPLDVVCTRLMTQASGGAVRYRGIWDALHQIRASGGIAALFSGSWPRLLYYMPFGALHLGIYELCRQMLTRPRTQDPRTR